MNQKNIFLGLGAVFLILITVFTVNHFNKSSKKDENPFLTINPAEEIERLQVKSDVEPDAMYPEGYVVGRFKKQMMTFKDLPVSTQFDLYKIKQETYMRSLVSMKENFLIMFNYVDSKLGYPTILPSITELLSVADPNDELVNERYQKVKDRYPIKDENLAKIQIKMEMKIQWHAEKFFKRLKQLEDNDTFRIYLLPPAHPSLKKIINPKDVAVLGSDDAKYELSIYTNYGCQLCKSLNLKVSDVVKTLGDNIRIKQIILNSPASKKHLLEEYVSHFMNCAYREDKDAYWKIHVDLIKNKEFQSLLAQPYDIWNKSGKIDPIFKKYLGSDFEDWKKCATDQQALKKTQALSDLLVKLLDIKVQPTYFLNNRYLDIVGGNITASIKEAVKNPNWK